MKMEITLDLSDVDYIALCPGYTERLLYHENENEWKMNSNPDLLEKIRRSEKENSDSIKRYGYGMHKENIYDIPNPELKFWLWGFWEDGTDFKERLQGETMKDSPCYKYLLEEYEDDEEEMLKAYKEDLPKPNVVPLLISDSDIYAFNFEETKTIINTFYPKWKNDLYGSIIFGPPSKDSKLELIDWRILARSIDIDFCAWLWS